LAILGSRACIVSDSLSGIHANGMLARILEVLRLSDGFAGSFVHRNII
jgi:hypothetical protein